MLIRVKVIIIHKELRNKKKLTALFQIFIKLVSLYTNSYLKHGLFLPLLKNENKNINTSHLTSHINIWL